jgi:hypothetical protein
MRDPKQFRKYAEECRRLAARMPEHRDALLQMADAWTACADETEGNGGRSGEARSGGKNGR